MTMPPVVLASSSPRRRELLALIGIPHSVYPANVDETYLEGELPREHAERLARAKAAKVASLERDSVVIGADTIVVVDDTVLGKPRDQTDAARMLAMLSGRTHLVITAVAVARGDEIVSDMEVVSVTFRDLNSIEIASYISTGEPMDKAGAYGIQGFGATIVRRVEGDYFAVMGLPLLRLVTLLGRVGVAYDFGR
ncbi:MAG: Maf family protein [Gemmatimonadaceae bacterium]